MNLLKRGKPVVVKGRGFTSKTNLPLASFNERGLTPEFNHVDEDPHVPVVGRAGASEQKAK